MKTPRQPRMADIAREANVNRITVSRALSRPELLAPETLERVRAAIARTGYIPNQIARGMKAAHSRIVSLVTPPHMAGVYGTIVEQLSAELFKAGLVVNLFPVHDNPDQQAAVLRELAGWRPAAIVTFGFVLTPESTSLLQNARVPLIELLTYSDTSLGSCVGYDQRDASRLLTEHLLARGYRKICYVHSARAASNVNTGRLGGFAEAIEAAGGVVRPRASEESGLDDPTNATLPVEGLTGIELKADAGFVNGNQLMARLAAWPVRPDAVLFASDITAVGALQYCVANAIAPGRDIGLCTFDGIALTSVIRPQLTCLDFPFERVIAEGVRQIVEQVRDQSVGGRRIRITAKVLPRQST